MAVQVFNIGTNASGSGATAVITVGAAGVPAGSLIVIAITEHDAQGTTGGGSVADSKVNTYNLPASLEKGDGSSYFTRVGYVFNSIALVQNDTITYTKKTSGNGAVISALYATGIQTSPDPLDTAATATNTGTSTTPTVTSGTPAGAGDLFVGALGNKGDSGTFTQDSTNGAWATPPNEASTGTTSSNTRIDGGTLVNASATAKTYAPTFSVSDVWVDIICAFKAIPSPTQIIILMGQALL